MKRLCAVKQRDGEKERERERERERENEWGRLFSCKLVGTCVPCTYSQCITLLASSTAPKLFITHVWCSLAAFNTHQHNSLSNQVQLESGCDNGSLRVPSLGLTR